MGDLNKFNRLHTFPLKLYLFLGKREGGMNMKHNCIANGYISKEMREQINPPVPFAP